MRMVPRDSDIKISPRIATIARVRNPVERPQALLHLAELCRSDDSHLDLRNLPQTLDEGRTIVRNVVPDSPAWRAGLTFNDELVAVDGARVTAATFAKRVGDRRPGDTSTITYVRRDELAAATHTLVESPERKLVLKPDAKARGLAKAVREGWLGIRS